MVNINYKLLITYIFCVKSPVLLGFLLLITVKESDGKTSKHPVIDFDFVSAVENFCTDFGYKLTDIIAVVVIDQ
jgi:hypothetical protein